MKKPKYVLIIVFLVFGIASSQDASINLYPNNINQEVAFGGDGKLTINAWANGNLSLVAERLFLDMNLTTLRVPIFANQNISSPIYDDVITVIKSVKQVNHNVKLMASLANGDGNGANFHGASKFFPQWIGCCSYNIYSLNLTAYASYLDSFMQLMQDNGIYIDYLAPFNEDPADNSDFAKVFNQMDNLGTTQKVGLERWGLKSSVNNIDDVESVLDIAGSHFYDDGTISDWDGTWAQLVDKSSIPIWYTEATRYTTTDGIDKLIAGMNNIFPSINGGAESVIFYQTLKRFVWSNGAISGNIKYTGFKNIVNGSNGKKVIDATVNGDNMRTTAFKGSSFISLHITNDDANTKTTKINILDGYTATGIITRTIWTDSQTEVSNSYSLNNVSSWNITIPANSYVHLNIPVVSQNTNTESPKLVHITKRNATGFAIDGNWNGEDEQNIYLWSKKESSVNQQWIEIDRGNGYYSYQKHGTNYCIYGNINTQNVCLWTCEESNYNQHWQKVDAGGGAYKLINRNAIGYAINGGSNGANRQNVNLYNSSSTSQNLQWFITPLGTAAKSVNDLPLVNDVLIYPNPMSDFATIEGAANSTIRIYNISGQELLVQQVLTDNEVLDLSLFPSGIYYAQVKGLESFSIVKVVKE